MGVKMRSSGLAMGLVMVIALSALAQQPPGLIPPRPAPKPAAAKAAPAPAVATVGALRITREEFEARASAAMKQYEQRLGSAVPNELQPAVRRQMLESLIRRDLLVLDAERRGMLGSVAEAEAQLQKDPAFSPNGVFDPARVQAVRQSNPALWQAATLQMRQQIGARRLGERLEKELTPGEAESRAVAERELSRAQVDYLGLRRAEFTTTATEPRERDVLEYYRTHAESFRRPDRAVLSIITIQDPARTDAETQNPEAGRAWESRMRTRADSLLAAIKGGTGFDAAADAFGGKRSNVVVTRDNFPGFWKGDDAARNAVFSARAASVLGTTVAATDGAMLVRVDEQRPSHIAPLREVAREVRSRLRTELRTSREDAELHALYPSLADSLRSTGYKVRYAAVDTARTVVPSPSASDLDRWYRAHLADYSAFDAASGSIKARPLADVMDDVRARWTREQRDQRARATIEAIDKAWRANRRDAAREREATLLRDIGPVILGAAADTGLAGKVVGDSLNARRGALGVGAAAYPRGFLVFNVYQSVPDVAPSFEQARPLLRTRMQQRQAEEDEVQARVLFDRNPARFAGGNVIHFSRLLVAPIPLLQIPLTRAEVERYHVAHIDRYSVAEEIRVRHILISPVDASPAADSAARVRLEALRARILAGADFVALATQYSEDPATQSKGGDLGWFGRGAMLEVFERAAFALQPGQLSDVIHSEVGYHLILMVDRLPAVAQPLSTMWANVGADAAQEKADSLAARRADSLYVSCRTPAQLKAAAARLKFEVTTFSYSASDRQVHVEMRPVLAALQTMKPGQIYPGSARLGGLGVGLFWVDSLGDAPAPTWENARQNAIDVYRSGAGQRALDAKRAELDSMMRSGVSFDSLGALWGGLSSHRHAPKGSGLPGMGGGEALDSLVIGLGRAAALSIGQLSDWLILNAGSARIRFQERVEPSATEIASRAEAERRQTYQRKLEAAFEQMKSRYAVKILDAKLRDTALPSAAVPAP